MNILINVKHNAIATLIAVAFLFSHSVSAQPLIGAYGAYLVSTGAPSSKSAPSRYAIGVSSLWQSKKGIELRLGLGYRVEDGGISSQYDSTLATTQNTNKLNVVDPIGGAGPTVETTIGLGTLECSATIAVPLAQIDTVGGGLLLLLGVGADRVLSGLQTDDYTAVPEFKGQKIQEFKMEPQFGFFAQVGIGASLPLGSSKLLIDLTYAFRQPGTISFSNPVSGGPKEQDISWLAGRGLRFQISYLFGL